MILAVFLYVAMALTAAVSAADDSPPVGTVIEGRASFTDGDTLYFTDAGGRRTYIRIQGIDAPELAQPCAAEDGKPGWHGVEALKGALDLAHGRGVICTVAEAVKSYGRLIATCEIGGQDFGRSMVRAGLAFDGCRDPDAVDAAGALKPGRRHSACYSRRRYAGDEAAARTASRGLWSSGRARCLAPWIYREQTRKRR